MKANMQCQMPGTKSTKRSDMEWRFSKPRLRLIGLPLFVHLSRFQLHLGFKNHHVNHKQYQSARSIKHWGSCSLLQDVANPWIEHIRFKTKSKYSHKFLKHLHTWCMLSSSLSPLKSDMATENPKQGQASLKIQKQDGEAPSWSGVTRGDGMKECFNWL